MNAREKKVTQAKSPKVPLLMNTVVTRRKYEIEISMQSSGNSEYEGRLSSGCTVTRGYHILYLEVGQDV